MHITPAEAQTPWLGWVMDWPWVCIWLTFLLIVGTILFLESDR